MLIASIDPGLHGAVVIMNENLQIKAVYDLPYIKWYNNWILDVDYVRNTFKYYMPEAVVIEKVGVMPTDGKTQAAHFMFHVGCLAGAAAGFNRVFVSPSAWKGGSGLIRKPKAVALEKAVELFGEEWFKGRKNAIDRADAAMMGRYYLRVVRGL